MPMPTEDDYKLVNKNQDDAIAELADAVLREHPEGRPARYNGPVYKAAWKVTEACQALKTVYTSPAPRAAIARLRAFLSVTAPDAFSASKTARRYRRYARCWRRTRPRRPPAGAHCRSARRRQCHAFRSPPRFRRNKIHAELAFGKVQSILRVIFFQTRT
jgi:hypothetical protein